MILKHLPTPSISSTPLLRPAGRPWLSALAGLLALGLGGCSADGKSPEKAPAPDVLPVVTLKTSERELFHDYVADVQAVRNVEVRAQVAGFLEDWVAH